MKKLQLLCVLASALFFTQCSEPAQEKHTPVPHNDLKLSDYVNPFIGTGGHGHTYPGASRPFGMMQLSPDSRLYGWDGCGGYHYSDSIIYGFSHTHLSGTGVPDYGDILLMPFTGENHWNNGYDGDVDQGYGSRFSHANETAKAGYYQVALADYNINAELTTSKRSGMHRYTFPEGEAQKVILDLAHRDQVLKSEFTIVNETTIEGVRISNAWAREQHAYFVMNFSRPFTNQLTMNDDSKLNAGNLLKAILEFEASNKPLLVRIGISAVDIEGARNNLATEINHWDFDKLHEESVAAWEKELHKIEITTEDKDELAVYYTALYHSFLNPNLFSDADGRYRGMDMQIHKSDKPVYTVFSLWDTFRGTHPLFTLVQQDRTNEFINTFLHQYQQGGTLPIWELSANYTGCMIGYHSIPVITDAYVKGIRDYDVDLAMKAMLTSSEADILGLKSYKKYGYIPAGDEPESVSKTLEYAYDDWCIAQMAGAMGKNETKDTYMERAQFYKNLYDPTSGFLRAKMNSSWFAPFDPAEVNFNYTEANAWQYSLFAPQDVDGLIKLMGGPEKLEAHLDALFVAPDATSGRHQVDITGLIGQYAHGNEPSHHMAYLYNYTGKPWKAQEKLDQIMNELYSNTPDGLSGNEDCGQMSSWYNLSAMGFYSVTPGTDYYMVGAPRFTETTMHLENGNTFTVKAPNRTKENKYIKSAKLNGEPFNSTFLMHEKIMAGGVLEFEMAATPNKSWAAEAASLPKANIDNTITPVPYFEASGKTFGESHDVVIGCADPATKIYYTLDSSEPSTSSALYTEPIHFTETTTIKALAVREDGQQSRISSADYFRIKSGRSIVLKTEYASQYSAGGDGALIDFLRGSNSYRTGHWQGFEKNDFEAVVDLGKIEPVNEIKVGFLQDVNSWIFYPKQVEISVSTDGVNFDHVTVIKNEFPDTEYGGMTQDFSVKLDGIEKRYVKVKALNHGPCPEWHLGAGGDTWLFLDEIVVE